MANDISIRRISKIAVEESIVPSKSGGKRLSSAVFTASSRDQDIYEGLSIDIEKVAHELGLDPKGSMNRGVFLGAISLKAKDYRDEQLMVGFDPEKDNPCHGQVWGNPGNKKRKRLLRKASWYVEIAGVSLSDGVQN
jgi:hypothetical protein